jgi:pyocin large subunit-like protein
MEIDPMSIESLAWALRQDCPSPTMKLVLIGLANHAHPDGTAEAWPAVATLASYSGVSERTVQRALRELEAIGLISQHSPRLNKRFEKRMA